MTEQTPTAAADEPRKVVRLSVNLAPDVAQQVEAMAAKAGSVTEATRRAFGLLALVQKAEDEGAKVVLQQAGQPDRELYLRP